MRPHYDVIAIKKKEDAVCVKREKKFEFIYRWRSSRPQTPNRDNLHMRFFSG